MYIDSVLGWREQTAERSKAVKDLSDRAQLLEDFRILKKQFITGAIQGAKSMGKHLFELDQDQREDLTYRLITGFDALDSTQQFKKNYGRIVNLQLEELRKQSHSQAGRFIAATSLMGEINERHAHLNRNMYSGFHLHLLTQETRQQVWRGLLLHPPVSREADIAIKRNIQILTSQQEVQLLKNIQTIMAVDFKELRSDYGIVTLVKQALSYFEHRHQLIIRNKHIALTMPLLHVFTEYRTAKTLPKFISFLYVVLLQISPLFAPDIAQLNQREFELYHMEQMENILEEYLKKEENQLYLHITDNIFNAEPASRMPSRAVSERTGVSRLRSEEPKQAITNLFRDFIEQMGAGFFGLPGCCVVWEQTLMLQNIEKKDMLRLLVAALKRTKRALLGTKSAFQFRETFKRELRSLSEYEVFVLYGDFFARRRGQLPPFEIKGLEEMKKLFGGLDEIMLKEQREKALQQRLKFQLPDQRKATKKLADNATADLAGAVLQETLERRKESGLAPSPAAAPTSISSPSPRIKKKGTKQDAISERDQEEEKSALSRPVSALSSVAPSETPPVDEDNPGNKRSLISLAGARIRSDIFMSFDDF